MTKYIFVTGGVVSGIGKGISAASIGRLLKSRGLSIFMQKFDPYINVDPGTMSPFQHGEVFVTKDGGETDLDLGHYERFTDVELTADSSITSGKIYNQVIVNERAGVYEGATVQVIPHITDEIKSKVYKVAETSSADVIITEIGGTVGDIESLPFIEAIRQIHSENKPEDVLFIHTTLIPTVPGSDELKTKPTQHSYKQLMGLGIKPDIFILRADRHVDEGIKKKISLFCDIPTEAIIQSDNVGLIYEVPLSFRDQNIDEYILDKLKIQTDRCEISEWEEMVKKFKAADRPVRIAIVGKYTKLHDAYLSVSQALLDAGYHQGALVEIQWVDSEGLTENTIDGALQNVDGILIPGGFGERGIAGMILSSRYAREHSIPYLGICLGMQIAVIDIARNVCGLEGAFSTEFAKNLRHPVVDLMKEQREVSDLGGTMRLGNWKCTLVPETKAHALYGNSEVMERHRHRYEINNDYKDSLARGGVVFSGINENKDLIEIIELIDHPFFVGSQFHPEFKSRPNNPHPLFLGFIEAALKSKGDRL